MGGADKQIQDQFQQQFGNTSNKFDTTQNQTQSGTQTGATTGATSSATNPWEASQPLLKNLLAKYGGLNTDVTPEQAAATSALISGASGVPAFGADASGAATRLFGADTSPQVGMLSKALADYQANIGRTASGAELDPYSTPGFGDAITRATNDITNKVKSVYAAAGRDPSGAGSFAGSLGRGLTEGIAPTIAAQFNQNKANQLAAAGQLFGAGGSTAGAITGQEQIPLTNAIQAVGLLPQVASAYTAPGAAQLSAANVAQNLPFANLAGLLSPALGLAGLGSQTAGTTAGSTSGTTAGTTTGGTTGTSAGTSFMQGTGHGETTVPQNTMSNVIGGMTALASLASLFSDERVKEDVAPVGMLNDGQRVFRYRYKGDPAMRIGLLAQSVEKFAPDAVGEVGGIKTVNYAKATDKAAAMERRAA